LAGTTTAQADRCTLGSCDRIPCGFGETGRASQELFLQVLHPLHPHGLPGFEALRLGYLDQCLGITLKLPIDRRVGTDHLGRGSGVLGFK
jgi:hypothetical protein